MTRMRKFTQLTYAQRDMLAEAVLFNGRIINPRAKRNHQQTLESLRRRGLVVPADNGNFRVTLQGVDLVLEPDSVVEVTDA